jgi:hypothetical protein
MSVMLRKAIKESSFLLAKKFQSCRMVRLFYIKFLIIPFRIRNDTLSAIACRIIYTVCARSSRLVSNAK